MSSAPRRFHRLLGIGVAAAALAVAACGGGGGDENRTPFAPNVPVVPTAVDVDAASFTPVTSSTGTYSISIPEGWAPVGGVGAATQEETWQLWTGERLTAEMAVTCEPIPNNPVTGEPFNNRDFADRDRALRGALGGAVIPDEGTEFGLTVADEPALGTTYTVTASGIAIRQQAIYVIKGDCAWILHLRVFGDGDAGGYARLFGRVVGSFRPIDN